MPLHLSADELQTVLDAARPLAPDVQDRFLAAVAHALQGREIGPGLVGRTCRELQKFYFHAPDLGNLGTPPKYRR